MKILIFFFLIIPCFITGRSTIENSLQISGLPYNAPPPENNDADIDSFKIMKYDPKPFDILITEIMADPSPSVLLPESEYLELHNKSNFTINLAGWKISIGNNTIKLYPSLMKPGDYLILTGTENASDFEKYGNVMSFDKFPYLTNSGQTIILRNNMNRMTHFVNYSVVWYNTEYKSEGGWSLEMIDLENPCGNMGNWTESTDYKGGSPGKRNSVADSNPDNTCPLLKRAAVVNDSEIQIYFNEPLDSISLVDFGSYSVDHNMGNPVNIFPVLPDFSSVILVFEKSFRDNILYTVTLQGPITDCAGNILEDKSYALFTLPESADSFDLVINEIMFNPRDNQEDFVEIYNRSYKTIDIRYFNIASRDPYSCEFKSCYPIIKEHYLLFPGKYLLLTTNYSNIQEQYNTANMDCCLELIKLPVFPDDEGVVTITDNKMNILDEFHYSADIHFKLINSTKGVSLERINFGWPTNDPNNWHSASEDCGFATPGIRNSQYFHSTAADTEIIIEPEVFSPDNDGYNDFVSIRYNFNDPGYVANITVFDAKGRIVRRLVKNTLLGTTGVFTWDGINEKNRRASTGIYLIYTEVFDLKGKVYKYKKTCVLALLMD